jgi:hypothetical protein
LGVNGFNPYRDWLALTAQRPNYFELLKLSPTESDPERIKQAAEAMLKQLAERTRELPTDDTARQQAKQQLIQQIRQAFQVLKDPAARSKYLQQLSSGATPGAKPTAAAQSAPAPTTQSAQPKSQPKPNTAPGKPLERVSPSPPSRVAKGPGDSLSQIALSANIATNAGATDSPLVDTSNSNEIRVSARPKRRRRQQSSWGAWLLILGLFVVAPLILIGVLLATGRWSLPGWNAPAVTAVSSDPNAVPEQPSTTAADSVTEKSDQENNGANSPPANIPTPPADTASNQSADKQRSDNSDPPKSAQGNSSPNRPTDAPSTENQSLHTPPPQTQPNESMPPRQNADQSSTDIDAPPPSTEELNPEQLAALQQITRILAVAKTSLRYRDYDTAALAVNRLADTSAFDRCSGGTISANDGRAWVNAIRGFWTTVDRSFEKLQPAKEFDFQGTQVPLIETANQRLVLRINGQPESYLFDDLSPPTLIELAESTGIEDIPSWRLQKATYLLLYGDLSLTEESEIREALSQSAADGHEVQAIEKLADLRMWLLTTEFEIIQGAPQLDNAQVTTAVLRQLGVDDVSQIDTPMALGLSQQLLESSIKSDSREERAKQLLVAWQLALTAGDYCRVDQVLTVLATDYALDRLGALAESFQEILSQPLPPPQQEQLILQFLTITESMIGQGNRTPRLESALNVARDLATKLDLPSLRLRIERLRSQLN